MRAEQSCPAPEHAVRVTSGRGMARRYVTNVASTNTILSARFMADPPKRALQACFQSCTQVGVDLAIPPRGDSTASPPTVLQVTFVYVTKSTMREKSARQSRRRPQ